MPFHCWWFPAGYVSARLSRRESASVRVCGCVLSNVIASWLCGFRLSGGSAGIPDSKQQHCWHITIKYKRLYFCYYLINTLHCQSGSTNSFSSMTQHILSRRNLVSWAALVFTLTFVTKHPRYAGDENTENFTRNAYSFLPTEIRILKSHRIY